jgi:GMP synthase (glutamine-hydrolysing)
MTAAVEILQLDLETPPGLLAEQLLADGAEVRVRCLDPDREPPGSVGGGSPLVVLGGAAAPPEWPLLVEPLRGRIEAGRPTLGLGQGAQLVALALGGSVRPGGAPEFGYVDLVPTERAASDPVVSCIGAGLPLMLWHDDGLDLPPAVEPLAHCHRGRVLAFRARGCVYGLRFHPGATAAMVRHWAAMRGEERNNLAVPVRIGAEVVRHQDRAERFGRTVAAGWLRLVAD